MTHFVSGLWPPRFGPVATLHTTITAVSLGAVGASPVSGSTEGTDLLTYTVPAGSGAGGDGTGTGLYIAIAALHIQTDSNAGTSQTLEINVTYNNGVAVTATALGEVLAGGMTGSTVAPVDTTTINLHTSQFGVFRAEAGTDITLRTLAVNGGTVATSGAIDLDFVIIRIG